MQQAYDTRKRAFLDAPVALAARSPRLATVLLHGKELRIVNLGLFFQALYHGVRQAMRGGTLALTCHRITTEFPTQVVATVALFGSLGWIAWHTIRGRLKPHAGIGIVRPSCVRGEPALRGGEKCMAGASLGRWIESLKGPTFTAREVRVFCVLVLCIAPIALIFVLFFGRALSPNEDIAGLGGDFPAFYVAGRLLNEYPPSRLYDIHLQEQLFLQVRPGERGFSLPYVHPPHLGLPFRLFALLSYGWAFAAWSAVSLSLYLAGLLAMIRHCGPARVADRHATILLALSFEPFLVETLAGGQVSSVAFFGLALAVANEHRRRPFVSGICLSLCAYRPTLIALLLLMFAVSRRWRILLGFAFGAAVLLALTVLTMGTSALVDYVSTTIQFGQRYAGSNDVLRTWKFVDLRAFATLLTGDHAVGLATATLAACWVLPRLVRVWWVTRRTDLPYPEGVWALAIVWMLLLNFYAPLYDCSLVVLVFILMAHTPAHRSPVAHEPVFQWLLLWTIVAAWISQIMARIGGLQILTLVLLLVALYANRLLDETHAARAPDA